MAKSKGRHTHNTGKNVYCDIDEYDIEDKTSRRSSRKRKDTRDRSRRERYYQGVDKTPEDQKLRYVDIPKDEQLAVLSMLMPYFKKKANVARSFGALSEADSEFYIAKMGDYAIQALPSYDESEGVKLSTFLIESVENRLIDDARALKKLKRIAIRVPISMDDYKTAADKGQIAEEALSDGLRGFRELIFRLDFDAFYEGLSELQKLWLEYRLSGLTFAQIAEFAGVDVTSTFIRRDWKPIMERARKYGFDNVETFRF